MVWTNTEKFDEEKQKEWNEAFFRNLNFIIVIVSFITLFCTAGLFYGLFGGSFNDFWSGPAAISKEEVQRRLDIFENKNEVDLVENGIHLQTGLIYADNFDLVKTTCTACHSAKLISQNRATREGWKEMIVWMQKTQGLWDLGRNEALILDYLETNYAPQETGRRPNLDVAAIEWFILDLEKK